MSEAGCTHRKVTTYVFVDGNAPAGLWACADCGHKFEPVNLIVEKDAERYRWLRDAPPLALSVRRTPGETAAGCYLDGSTLDAAVDAAMAAAPAVGAA